MGDHKGQHWVKGHTSHSSRGKEYTVKGHWAKDPGPYHRTHSKTQHRKHREQVQDDRTRIANLERRNMSGGAPGTYDLVDDMGPVGWWRYNEDVGSSTVADSGSYGFDGTYVGAAQSGASPSPSPDEENEFSGAFSGYNSGTAFLGQTAVPGYVDVGHASAYGFIDSSFTVGFWFKTTFPSGPALYPTGSGVTVAVQGLGGTWDATTHDGWKFDLVNGHLGGDASDAADGYVLAFYRNGATSEPTCKTSHVPYGVWLFATMTFDADTFKTKLFINGALYSMDKAADGTNSQGIGLKWGMSQSSGVYNPYFSGSQDEAIIFDYALTDAQVASLYHGAVPADEDTTFHGIVDDGGNPLVSGGAQDTVLATDGDVSWHKIKNAYVDAAAAIAYSKLALTGSILNADIAAGANVSVSKLANGSSGQFLQTVGSTPTWVTVSTTSIGAIADPGGTSGDVLVYSSGWTNAKIANTNVASGAAIAYSKLALTGAILNADISASAAIAYSKLALSASIVNADIASAAAIAYSKLSLTNHIVDADIASGAAITYSKLNLSASVVNADIATGAAIAVSKLAAGSSGYVLQTVAGVPTWVSPATLTATIIRALFVDWLGDLPDVPETGQAFLIPKLGGASVTFNLDRAVLRVETAGSSTTTVRIQKATGTGAFGAGTDLCTLSIASSVYEDSETSFGGAQVSSDDKVRIVWDAIGTDAADFFVQLEGTQV